MDIKIRNANATDAPFLAKMILQSSRAGKKDGIFDVAFDMKDDKKVLEKLEMLVQTTAKNYTHFSNFLVAQMDGKSVGSLCSYEPRIATKDQLIVALKELGCNDEAKNRLNVYYDCDFKLNNRTLMFDFMEEEDDFLDVGILKALMQKSLLTARLKGYRIAQTVIEIGSLEAELFYKKLGFHIVEQKECELYKEKFGRAGLMLMAIEF